MKYALAPSLSPVVSARSASARSAFFFMSLCWAWASALSYAARASLALLAAFSSSPIRSQVWASSSRRATARWNSSSARASSPVVRCSRPITISAATSSAFLSISFWYSSLSRSIVRYRRYISSSLASADASCGLARSTAL